MRENVRADDTLMVNQRFLTGEFLTEMKRMDIHKGGARTVMQCKIASARFLLLSCIAVFCAGSLTTGHDERIVIPNITQIRVGIEPRVAKPFP